MVYRVKILKFWFYSSRFAILVLEFYTAEYVLPCQTAFTCSFHENFVTDNRSSETSWLKKKKKERKTIFNSR